MTLTVWYNAHVLRRERMFFMCRTIFKKLAKRFSLVVFCHLVPCGTGISSLAPCNYGEGPTCRLVSLASNTFAQFFHKPTGFDNSCVAHGDLVDTMTSVKPGENPCPSGYYFRKDLSLLPSPIIGNSKMVNGLCLSEAPEYSKNGGDANTLGNLISRRSVLRSDHYAALPEYSGVCPAGYDLVGLTLNPDLDKKCFKNDAVEYNLCVGSKATSGAIRVSEVADCVLEKSTVYNNLLLDFVNYVWSSVSEFLEYAGVYWAIGLIGRMINMSFALIKGVWSAINSAIRLLVWIRTKYTEFDEFISCYLGYKK